MREVYFRKVGDIVSLQPYFYIENGKEHLVYTDNPHEIDLARVKYGGVYFTLAEVRAVLNAPKKAKTRHFTDEERKQWELEQIAFGKSETPENERPPKRLTEYERLVAEFEFAAQYEHWSESEYKRKRKAFNQRNWYLRKLCGGAYA